MLWSGMREESESKEEPRGRVGHEMNLKKKGKFTYIPISKHQFFSNDNNNIIS